MTRRWSPAGMVLLIVMAFVVTSLVGDDAWAARRHRHRHTRIWVGHRIVVGKPVVVTPVIINGRAHGVIDLNVDPDDTEVYVDGKLRGTVDDFDGAPGKLHLLPGTHRIRLQAPDGDEWIRKVKVVAGHEINIKLELDEEADDAKNDEEEE